MDGWENVSRVRTGRKCCSRSWKLYRASEGCSDCLCGVLRRSVRARRLICVFCVAVWEGGLCVMVMYEELWVVQCRTCRVGCEEALGHIGDIITF